MPDAQRAIEEIRFVMQSEVWEMTDDLRAAASLYAEACRDVNGRLRRCDEFLKRGLRSEAIHLAEAEPKLLEVIGLLDFPERRDWDDALGLYGMTPPEPLRLDIARELNEAYVIEQPLQKLMSKLRLLALARAPLNQRLAVMRKLASLDQGSPFWEDDIREFEQARWREIDAAARSAARAVDTVTLQSLAKEVNETDWRDGVPKQLTTTVRQLAAQVDRHVADRDLGPLADQLDAAFSALDLAAARQLRPRWQNLAARAKLPDGDPRAERVAPILGWVVDEDQRESSDQGFRRAVAVLEQVLADNEDRDTLERAAHEAQKFERALPEPLVLRYRNRVAALDLEERRGRMLKIGGVSAALLLVATLVGVVIRKQLATAEANRIAAAATELIESGELDDARTLLAGHGDLTGWDSLLAAQQRLATAETAEVERVAGFAAALGRIENAETYATATSEIEQARSLARTNDDKLALSELQQSWDERHRTSMAALEQEVGAGIASATAQLVEFEGLAATQPSNQAATALRGELQLQLTGLTHAARELRPEVRSQIDILAKRHAAAEQLLARRRRELTAMEQLTKATLAAPDGAGAKSISEACVTALNEYAAALETAPTADRVRQTVGEQVYWTGVLEWARLTSTWQELWPATDENLRARAGECDRYIKAHGTSPSIADARLYHSALTSLLLRDAGASGEASRGQRTRLEQYFSLPVIKESWTLRTKEGKTYYTLETLDFSDEPMEKPVRVEHYIGYTREDKEPASIKVKDLENRTAMPAPQSVIAEQVLERLHQLDVATWEPYLLELAAEIRGGKDLDPFLKFDLLKRTLEAATATSPFLANPLKPHLAALQTNRVDPAARWMAPNDPNAPDARAAAQEIVARLPDLAAAWSQAAAERQALAGRLQQPSRMIGWLSRSEQGWECRTNWRPDGRYRLQVAYAETTDGPSVWRQVGETTTETMSLRSGENAFFKEGRPVFAVREGTAGAADLTAQEP